MHGSPASELLFEYYCKVAKSWQGFAADKYFCPLSPSTGFHANLSVSPLTQFIDSIWSWTPASLPRGSGQFVSPSKEDGTVLGPREKSERHHTVKKTCPDSLAGVTKQPESI